MLVGKPSCSSSETDSMFSVVSGFPVLLASSWQYIIGVVQHPFLLSMSAWTFRSQGAVMELFLEASKTAERCLVS